MSFESVDVLTPAVILAQTGFFRELNPQQLAGVAELAQAQLFEEGQTVYRFGEAARWLYVLARGTVRLTTGHGGRHASVGDQLGRGDVFGWAALTPHCSLRIATATCVTPCRMLAIDGAGLLVRMDADHTLGYRLMSQLNQLVTGTLTAFAAG